MTTASERARSLRFAGEMLNEVMTNQALPEHLRHQARVVMRHYPSTEEIAAMAKIEAMRAQMSRHPLFPAWLAPEDRAKDADVLPHVDTPTLGLDAAHDAAIELLKRVRQVAWIGLADGRTMEEKDRALREVQKLTQMFGND